MLLIFKEIVLRKASSTRKNSSEEGESSSTSTNQKMKNPPVKKTPVDKKTKKEPTVKNTTNEVIFPLQMHSKGQSISLFILSSPVCLGFFDSSYCFCEWGNIETFSTFCE